MSDTTPRASSPSSGSSAVLSPGRPALESLPPFKVLLHNDDVNTHEHVVTSILELTSLNRIRAIEAMLEAEVSGVGLLMVTHKEAAELHQEQLRSKSLTVTIEPA